MPLCIATGDWKPLVQSTGGRIFASDLTIKDSIETLKQPGLSFEFTEFLKQNILKALILLIIFFFLVYFVVKWILSALFNLERTENLPFWSKLLLVFVALGVMAVIHLTYTYFVLGNGFMEALPFNGIYTLFQDGNYKLITDAVGSFSTLSANVAENSSMNLDGVLL